MGSKSQRKGAAGERELAALLSAAGYECQRGGSLSFGKIPDVLGLPGIHAAGGLAEALQLQVKTASPAALETLGLALIDG